MKKFIDLKKWHKYWEIQKEISDLQTAISPVTAKVNALVKESNELLISEDDFNSKYESVIGRKISDVVFQEINKDVIDGWVKKANLDEPRILILN